MLKIGTNVLEFAQDFRLNFAIVNFCFDLIFNFFAVELFGLFGFDDLG